MPYSFIQGAAFTQAGAAFAQIEEDACVIGQPGLGQGLHNHTILDPDSEASLRDYSSTLKSDWACTTAHLRISD
jgi:hypothetical protein